MMERLRTRVSHELRQRPAAILIAGRTAGFVAAFAIPVALARLFDQTEFGTYKQLFLIYATLYGVAQLGVAESLYYFVPRNGQNAGRHAFNALTTLTGIGIVCVALLGINADRIGQWLMNPELADSVFPLGVFAALMLVTAPYEIVLVSRKRYLAAASIYAISDVGRTALMILAAALLGGVRWVVWGAVVFAAARLLSMLWSFWREFKTDLRPDFTLWKYQLAYALPFALAVGIEVVQSNFHQYVVASRFDAAAFAIFAVGCLQIPLVDVVASSSANVMMVKMADARFDSRGPQALALWHHTVARLAMIIFPLTVFLLIAARDIIVTLFTQSYAPAVPIFMVSTLTILLSVFCVDAVLRVHAQTRFLFGLNVLRLALVAGLIGWCLSRFGLVGAVLITVASTTLVRIIGLARIASLMNVGLSGALPWRRLSLTAVWALLAAIPSVWIVTTLSLPAVVELACAGVTYTATYMALRLADGTLLSEPVVHAPFTECVETTARR